MDKDYLQLLTFLRELGLENLSKSEKKSLYQRLKSGMSLDDIKDELEALNAINRLLIDSYGEVSLSNMNRINNEIDEVSLFKMFVIYEKIKLKGKVGLDAHKEFKKTTLSVLKDDKHVNFELEQIAKVATTHLQLQQEALYATMLSKDKADLLLKNCYKRASVSLRNAQANNLAKIVYCLKRNFNFSDDDLLEVSNQCATLFAHSSAEKLINLNFTLENFKKYIQEQLNISNKSIVASKFLNRDLKDVLSNSASIAIADSKTIEKTIEFLKGKEESVIKDESTGDIIRFRGNFTPGQLAKIFSKSITTLSSGMGKINDSCEGIYNAYKKYYNFPLNLTNLVNGRNFASLVSLRKEDYDVNGKIKEIFELLSPFVEKDDMQNILENNFGFLKASVEDVKLGIQEAILESKNNDDLRKQILKRIDGQFSRDKGIFPNVYREKTLVNDKKKVVKINSLQEEEILALLSKLETNESKVNEWKKNWNKEEKEYRQLELQIDLENILSQANNLVEMLNFNLNNVTDFSSEIETIKDLFNELLEERNIVIGSNKLNKQTDKLNNQIEEVLGRVKLKINAKIEILIREYETMISNLDMDLKDILSSKEKYLKLIDKLNDIEQEIEVVGIDDSELEKQKREIEEISSIISKVSKEQKRLDAIAAKCNSKVNGFGDLLVDLERRQVLKNPKGIINEGNINSARYLFDLFVYILYKNDYVCNPESINFKRVSELDKKMNINEYYTLLDEKSRAVAKEIYEGFEYASIKGQEIFDLMCNKLEEYNKYDDSVRTETRALEILSGLYENLSRDFYNKDALLKRKGQFNREIGKYNIDKLNEGLTKLIDAIEGYKQEINNWSNKKI